MERKRNFQQEQRRYATSAKVREPTLADKFRSLEKKVSIQEKDNVTKKKTKEFQFPFKWKMKFNQAKRPANNEMMLVFFMNKKNELEPPKFMPIFDGNMIIWKNTPYEFDPRAVWTVKGMRGNPKAYFLKEIDRRPVMNKLYNREIYKDAAVSNMDLDEIRARGDSTESDAFLVKAVLSARLAKTKIPINKGILIIIILAIVAAVIYFVSKGGGTPAG